jgi:hypothetical protein
VESAQRDLEDIAPPMSVTSDELEEPGEEADPFTVGRGQGRGTRNAPNAKSHIDTSARPTPGTTSRPAAHAHRSGGQR